MKPKSILRVSIILIAAAASIFFLESKRQANNLTSRSVIEVCCNPDVITASNNDFIFFESISKYLVVSFIK